MNNQIQNSSISYYPRAQVNTEDFERKNDWRDFLWNYPDFIIKVFSVTRPISLIVLYGFLCFNIFNYAINYDFSNHFIRAEENKVVEGVVGELDNLNPIFTSNNPFDKDIHALVFEKFIEIDKSGNPKPNIAKAWKIESDKKFVFEIDRGLLFHDGEKLTAKDVEFTFNTAIYLAQDHDFNTIGKSLEGVKVTAVGDYTVEFELSEENATFFEAVSVYIVPEHYFSRVNRDRLLYSFVNDEPIGSGPYKIIERKDDRVLLEASKYHSPIPKIQYFEYRLFTSFEGMKVAYQNNLLDTISHAYYYGDQFRNVNYNFNEYLMPIPTRKRVIFMNTRDSLESIAIRQGVNYLVNKENLIENTAVNGKVVYGPINENSWAYDDNFIKYKLSLEKSRKKFIEAGYEFNEDTGYFQDDQGKVLSLTLSYLDNEINRQLANELKIQFEQGGVLLDIEESALNYHDISRKVIATRDFDLLLYEIETTIDPDQYNLWHSLKVDYPNLNIAGETEKHEAIDKALVEARLNLERDGEMGRKFFYAKFQKYLMADSPVVFLYRPYESYFVSEGIDVGEFNELNYYSDRFDDVEYWEMN